MKSETYDGKHDWDAQFKEVPKFDANNEVINYIVEEAPVANYEAKIATESATKFVVTNTSTEKVVIGVTKTWIGDVGEKITVYLKNGEKTVGQKTITKEFKGDNKTWKFEFDPVPKYDDLGKEIEYTVTEDTVDGYEKPVITKEGNSGFAITNKQKHKEDKITVKVTKKWFAITGRPATAGAAVTLTLKANGKDVGTITKQLSDFGNNTSLEISFGEQPKYDANNKEIVYTVEETPVEGYNTTVDKESNEKFTVNNTEKQRQDKVTVKATKKWLSVSGRPASAGATITLYLKANGTVVDTVTKSAAEFKNNSSLGISFKEQPKFDKDNNEIVYTVEEADVKGYDKEVTETSKYNFVVTNKEIRKDEKVRFSVTKKWLGLVGKEVTLYLKNGSETVDTLVLKSETYDGKHDWDAQFKEVPKFDANNEVINYIVEEAPVANYEAKIATESATKFVVTNTSTEKVVIGVTKTWIGDVGEKITVYLKNGEKTVGQKTITKEFKGDNKTWKFEFDPVPKYDDLGKEIEYTVTEDTVDGYEKPVITKDGNSGFAITNKQKHKEDKITVKATKKWLSVSGRPASAGATITLNLKANGTVVDTVTRTAADFKNDSSLGISFKEQPKFDKDNNEIVYTVEEAEISGYDTDITGDQNNGFVVTNKEKQKDDKVTVSVTKKWLTIKGKPASAGAMITLKLMKGSEVVKTVTKTAAEFGNADSMTFSFEPVPKFDENNKIIKYTVVEEALAGYETAVEEPSENNFVVTNKETHKKVKKDIKVTKTWIGRVGEAITITLKDSKTGTTLDSILVTKGSIGLVEKENTPGKNMTTWEITLKADRYDVNNDEITYTAEESKLDGYKSNVKVVTDGSIVITNTETVPVKITKQWIGSSAAAINLYVYNNKGKQPDKIVLNASAAATSADGMTWAVTRELPKYDEAGNEITYTVGEDRVTGFDEGVVSGSQTEGFTIVNKKTPEPKAQKDIKVTKTWIGRVGEAITITLKDSKTGTPLDSILVTKGSIGLIEKENTPGKNMTTWEITLKADKYDKDKNEITYTAEEANLNGYKSNVKVVTDGGIVITNTETVPVKITKQWIGSSAAAINVYVYNNKGKQPDKIVLNASAAATSADGMTWAVTRELPKYDEAGNEITYTVGEDRVTGFDEGVVSGSQTEGFTIVNKKTPEPKAQKDIKVTKTWIGRVGEAITITLKDSKTGTPLDSILVTKGSIGLIEKENTPGKNMTTWEITLKADKYDKDKNEITYTAEEANLNGYKSNVKVVTDGGIVITNTETVPVKITKQWIGSSAAAINVYVYNNKGKQPDKIVLNASAAATSADGMTWAVTRELPKYDEAGNEITYTVGEDRVTGFDEGVVSGSQTEGFTIVNKKTPEPKAQKDIKVTKTWIGRVGEAITITLKDSKTGTPLDSILVTKGSIGLIEKENTPGKNMTTWEITLKADKYDKDKNEITYTAEESKLDGYKSNVKVVTDGSIVITNTETVPVKITKQWIGSSAAAINLYVYNNKGKQPDKIVLNASAAATSADGMTWAVTRELPKYDEAGNEITYTVGEDRVTGFDEGVVSGNQTEGFTIVNKKTPEPNPNGEKVKIKVNKNWVGKIADEIKVSLMSGSSIVETKTVTASATNAWEVEFEAPKNDASGSAIAYTVTEAAIAGYTAKVDGNQGTGFTITNTEIPTTGEKVNLKVTKTWIGKVGDAITIRLRDKNTGATLGSIRVTASTASLVAIRNASMPSITTWEVPLEADKYNVSGEAITYAVEEAEISGYKIKVTGDQNNGFTITNTETVPVKVTKKWDGKVGEAINVYIKNGSQVVEKKIVTKAAVVSGDSTTWAITVDVPKYDESGKEIDYSVDEDAMSGYTKAISGDKNKGFVITNKEKPQEPNTPPTPPTPPTPVIPVIPVTPNPNNPPTPPTPPTPTPNIPSIPIDPDPTPRDVPKFPENNKPDPNKPGSPDEFITVDKDGTPKGRYVKSKKPNGENTYIEVDLDKTPKGATPKRSLPHTGGTDNMVYYVGGFTMLMFAGVVLLRRRKEQDAN